MYLPKTGAGDGLERILNPAQWVALHPGYSQGGVTQSYGALLSSNVIDYDNGVTFEKKHRYSLNMKGAVRVQNAHIQKGETK